MTEEQRAKLKNGDYVYSLSNGNLYRVIDYAGQLVIFVDEDAHGVLVKNLSLYDYKVVKVSIVEEN